jgi:hypothetical protein
MEANQHTITAKVKTALFDVVSPDDFQTQAGRSIDPQVVIEHPAISLYCLDHANQQAIFVETSPEVDLLRAPFLFIAQYEAAQRLITVPYATFRALAREVQIDETRIVLVHSTGRCGSTLLSHVLNEEPTVASFAEPDVFSQLVMLRTAGKSTEAEITALLHASLNVMCANAERQGFQYWAFKFRSYVLTVGDLLYQAVPTAKTLFLYRNALPYARSFTRAFGMTDAELAEEVEESQRWLMPGIDTYLKTHGHPIPYLDFLALHWLASMQDCRRLQEQGAPMLCARYEELKTAPREVIQALLDYCGIPLPDSERLARVLAADSQAGTTAAQTSIQEPVRRLTEADLAELNRLIPQYDPTFAADTLLPHTIQLHGGGRGSGAGDQE